MREAVLAVDVGGTRIKAAWLDRDIRSLAAWTVPTPVGRTVDETVDAIIALVGEEAVQPPEGIRPLAIGVAVPGLVDEERGVAIYSENLGWHDRDFERLLAARTGLPVALSQDVRAGARAEALDGAAADVTSALFVPIGTGIGGAVILDGEVRSGPNNRAGELGHVRVGAETDACLCGQRGCLEAIASAVAIARQYRERTGAALDAAGVVDRAQQGDSDARAVWARATDALASVLSGADALLDLEAVVLGGGVALAGDFLVEPVKAGLGALGSPHVAVLTARHGDRAGCRGAGLRAWATAR
ncbi:ROK family protein [Herbiconiux daphne]|uniref:ROK family protein n=1 Tax=Herbiconiux daphne TaxID=2970914 RepID=A0ABT2GW45_9MICO|nr:ROK family protein [Herbiconiux daphne]MCS5732184.1 ROK family protein [Herbiconiux daphne]